MKGLQMNYTVDVSIPALGETHQVKASRGTKFDLVYDELCRKLNISERHWYGFRYPKNKTRFHKKTKYKWVDGSTRVGKLPITPGMERLTVELAIRFYPTDVESQMQEDFTLRFFYYQVRLELMKNSAKITDPVDDLIHLAAVARERNLNATIFSKIRTFWQHFT